MVLNGIDIYMNIPVFNADEKNYFNLSLMNMKEIT